MEIAKVAEYARSLYDAHGEKAEAEAALKAKMHEEAGDTKEAQDWRSIRNAIRELRGAHES